mmetsp:Transcript_20186/g.51139  ORF Transcript_20186/g.51139 Transcript_20186/m.51139 type:complete len:184 (-) Transcript_20186:392-943(-)|eukprot:CAMPEP_0202859164 /NCGR_PEP_ID=MMETSP1391-20130828/1403_1 /ASSEMBLY_ACC=CAM_ASM_000867 /TAXON_ID=1034604 /ORGANISM="Chlamydomonas leiostraca, Strain SAG 11-49" /LENGTH=183 /DNA_ID=CAMNT_0049538175 /DNA_START=346 /DNA_END=897 /DNA_ORIENTATION=+
MAPPGGAPAVMALLAAACLLLACSVPAVQAAVEADCSDVEQYYVRTIMGNITEKCNMECYNGTKILIPRECCPLCYPALNAARTVIDRWFTKCDASNDLDLAEERAQLGAFYALQSAAASACRVAPSPATPPPAPSDASLKDFRVFRVGIDVDGTSAATGLLPSWSLAVSGAVCALLLMAMAL